MPSLHKCLVMSVYGSTEMNLETNCQVGYPVCHRNNGNDKRGQFKTIYVDSLDAVRAHLKQGDTSGVCTASTTNGMR